MSVERKFTRLLAFHYLALCASPLIFLGTKLGLYNPNWRYRKHDLEVLKMCYTASVVSLKEHRKNQNYQTLDTVKNNEYLHALERSEELPLIREINKLITDDPLLSVELTQLKFDEISHKLKKNQPLAQDEIDILDKNRKIVFHALKKIPHNKLDSDELFLGLFIITSLLFLCCEYYGITHPFSLHIYKIQNAYTTPYVNVEPAPGPQYTMH